MAGQQLFPASQPLAIECAKHNVRRDQHTPNTGPPEAALSINSSILLSLLETGQEIRDLFDSGLPVKKGHVLYFYGFGD